jgi:hypothetical protein
MISKNKHKELKLRQKSKDITYISEGAQRQCLLRPVNSKFQKTYYKNATNNQSKSKRRRHSGHLSAE